MSSLFGKAQAIRLFFIILYLPPLIALILLAIVSSQTGIPIGKFMRDPTTVANVHPFVGLMSNFGVLLWCASAAICLFGWTILRHRLGEIKFPKFLLYSGLMTTLLLLDDLFLFHEEIFPRYFGVPQTIILIGYGVLTLCWLMMFKGCILKTEYFILLIALGFFGLSVSIDIFQHRIEPFVGHWRIFFEDGFKLLGIVGWFGYLTRCCFVKINGIPRERGTSSIL